MTKIALILVLFLCFGCSDARLLGKEGRLYLGIPFGQSTQDMEARKNIALKFGLVSEGMTKKDVLDKFGEPSNTAVFKDKYEVWYYRSVLPAQELEPIREVYIYFNNYKVINPPK